MFLEKASRPKPMLLYPVLWQEARRLWDGFLEVTLVGGWERNCMGADERKDFVLVLLIFLASCSPETFFTSAILADCFQPNIFKKIEN